MVCSATMPFHRTISYCMTLSLGKVSWAVSVVHPRSQVSSKPLASFFVSRIGCRGKDLPATRTVGAKKVMTFACVAPRRSVFFFQAEDGIRDYKVTGVQTCALPI